MLDLKKILIFLCLHATAVCYGQYVPESIYTTWSDLVPQTKYDHLSATQNLDLETLKLAYTLDDSATIEKTLSSLLSELGFKFDTQKVSEGFFTLTYVPSIFRVAHPLNSAIKMGGTILVQISKQPHGGIGVVTSFATKEGVTIDFVRFILTLQTNAYSIVGHEVTHFMHLNNQDETGLISPNENLYTTQVRGHFPKISVYKNGYAVTEIAAHYGDGESYRHEDHQFMSALDVKGKFSLSYTMAYELMTLSKQVLQRFESDADFFVEIGKYMFYENGLYGVALSSEPFSSGDITQFRGLVIFMKDKDAVRIESIKKFVQKHLDYSESVLKRISIQPEGVTSEAEASDVLLQQVPK